MIESFNNIVKRKAKPKAEFPTEQSLDIFIGIQALSYNDRYFNRIHKGFGQVQDTLESYFDLEDKLKNQSKGKIYLHIKFDSFYLVKHDLPFEARSNVIGFHDSSVRNFCVFFRRD